ncbi:MAG: RNA polymerase factor sigma-54, partial [bacterium]|nr:RNA polymerase factor sigma-54 [bacterium]
EIDWTSVFGGEVGSEFGLPAFSDNAEEDTDRQEQFHSEINFLDSLRDQLSMDVRLSDADREIGEQLLGALKQSGYLDNDVVHFLSNKLDVEPEEVERVLKCLQDYDPPGIFARTLQESLLIQLRRKKNDLLPQNPNRLVYSKAIQLLTEHFELIARRRFEQIQISTGWSEDETKQIFAVIQALQPIPGVGNEVQEFVTPDIWVALQPRDTAPPNRIVELDSGKQFFLYLNDATVPDLRISRKYREMFMERNLDTNTKQWLAQKFEAARNFVKAIQSRHKTILDVMEWIIRYQYRFFITGETLIPLTQIQVADRAGCDNSTVSRAIKDKYVETDWGIFPLKHFFSGGLESDFGGDVSTREIKQKLSELIENEDKHNPLTDQSLCDALNGMGYHLARRTVQKYREQLGYPLARFRRTL